MAKATSLCPIFGNLPETNVISDNRNYFIARNEYENNAKMLSL